MNTTSLLVSDLLTYVSAIMKEMYHKVTLNRMKYMLWEKE